MWLDRKSKTARIANSSGKSPLTCGAHWIRAVFTGRLTDYMYAPLQDNFYGDDEGPSLVYLYVLAFRVSGDTCGSFGVHYDFSSLFLFLTA